jgi:hypothetical protein
MALVKILGKTKVTDDGKFIVTSNVGVQDFTIWEYSDPSGSVNVTNFSVGYDSGNVTLNWGTGSQQINSEEIVNFSI